MLCTLTLWLGHYLVPIVAAEVYLLPQMQRRHLGIDDEEDEEEEEESSDLDSDEEEEEEEEEGVLIFRDDTSTFGSRACERTVVSL